MSRKFRPVSQSGIYSVRGSEIARTGNTNPTQIRCVVELQDDSEFIIDLDKNEKGEILYQALFKHLELVERDFFGLEFLAESPDRMQWLSKDKAIRKQVKGSPPYVFYFKVRFFVSDPSKLSEDITRYQFYLQVKRDILTGKLPCLYDTAAELGSYVLQSELGDYDPRIHTDGYVSEFRFIPDQTEDFEERVAEFHKHHIGQSQADAEFNYLEVAKGLDLYGVDLHFAKDHDSTDLFIGISPLGITVYHNKCKINFFPWSKIIKVCFKRKRFFVQIRPDWNEWTDNIIGFHMTTYRACKNLWKTCVEYHSFYRTHYPKPSDKRVIRLGSKYRYKGKTEYQAIEEGRRQQRVEPKIVRTLSRRYSRRSDDGSSFRSRSKNSILDRDISRENSMFTEKVLCHHQHTASSCSSPEREDGSNRLHVDGGELQQFSRSPESQRRNFNSTPGCGDSGGDSPVKNGSTPIVGLISVRIEPDEAGKFGFNVQGGRDVNLPVIVSKIAPGTPADLCMPQLQEGDEITLINGQDVKGLTHREVVELIKTITHSSKKVLMLTVRPNVFVPPEAQFEDSRVLSPEQHQVAATRHRQEIQDERRSRIVARDEEALRVSLDQLRENIESGDLLIYFQELYRKKPGLSCENARKPENLPKNRYRDILPYDDTRVKLYKSRSDYINANYVNMEVTSKGHLNRYITAQGPLEKTCGDFWQMVWEQEATLVVMLTTTIERGRVKCHQYWPEGEETLSFGDLEISCTKIRDFSPSYIYREMYVTDVKCLRSRVVVQLQYIAWPDHDVPDDASDFIDFVHSVRHYREGTNSPVIVHCSAGVGRSGVLMFVETAFEMIEGAEPIYPLEIVRRMRDQRASSIQTPGQFLFCCEATLKAFNEGIVKPLKR